jgi:hypothetical protein
MKVCITLFAALAALFLTTNAGYGQCGTEISCGPTPVITCAQPIVSISCDVVGQAPFTFSWANDEGNIISTENLLTTSLPGVYTLAVIDVTGCATMVEVLVAEDTQTPQFSLAIEVESQPYCSADADGVISVQASGGVPPYAYLWSGGNPDGPLLTGLSAGIYEVTVTDAAGCTAVASATLEPALRADAGPDLIGFCQASEVTLGGFAHTEVYFSSDLTPIEFANSDGESVAFTGVPGRIGSNPSPPDWPNTNGLTLSIATQNVRVGELVCLPVRAYGFEDIVSFAFTINFDAARLRFDRVEQFHPGVPSFSAGANTGTSPDFPGRIGVSWLHPALSGVSLPDEAILFTLCFEVLDNQAPASSSGPDIAYLWTGPEGFSSTLLFPQVSTPGTYHLRVIDTSLPDCYTEDEVEVIDGLALQLGYTLLSCDSAHLSFSALLPVAEGEWIYPDGSVALGSEIMTGQSGYHHFSATDAGTGCTIADSILISFDPTVCVTIAGRLVRDTVADCIAMAEEPGLHNRLIAFEGSGQTWYAVTQADGYYEKRLPTGDYEVFPILPNDLWLNCEERYPVSLPSAGDATVLDIPVLATGACPELSINLSMPLLRACWPRTLHLSYCNPGAATAEDAYVVLTLDEYFTFISASLPLIAQEGDQYTFFIGELSVNECGVFAVQTEVSCQAVWGQTLCAEAKIFPHGPCSPPSPLWSGASLRVSGQCAGDEARFVVENIGIGDMDTPSRAIIIEDAVMLMAVPDTVQLDSGVAIEYALPANGATYRLEVEQVPFHPGASRPSAVLEGCGTAAQGGFSTGFVNQFPLDDEDAFVDIECREIVAAYDPNDKHGFPRGYGEQHRIYPGVGLEYLVRFQNTGNDTAFLVVIRDTLSPLLDVASIRPGAASHPYTWDIDGQNVLVFTFEDILLPDSTTNLEGSQGFIEFKIAPREGLPLGTRIENRAAIYFDLNAPIITNTTFHTLGIDFVETITAVPDPGRTAWGVKAHPNPAEGWALFRLEGWPAEGGWFELFGSQGQTLRQQRFSGAKFRFERGELPPGIYFYRFRDRLGRQASGKLVLR